MRTIDFLTAQSAVTDGAWKDTSRYINKTFFFENVAVGDVVQVRYWDAKIKPADTFHGNQAGSDVTSATAGTPIILNDLHAWAKVRKTVAGGTPGATNASALVAEPEALP